jgi:tetratricopeptide (TPR) repeat protein
MILVTVFAVACSTDVERAHELVEAGKYTQAIALLEKVQADEADYQDAQYGIRSALRARIQADFNRARSHFEEKRWEDALEVFRKIDTEDPRIVGRKIPPPDAHPDGFLHAINTQEKYHNHIQSRIQDCERHLKVTDLLANGIKSLSDARTYIIGLWAGGTHNYMYSVSQYHIRENGVWRSNVVSARTSAGLKDKKWHNGSSDTGRWDIVERSYRDTGERYFLLRFVGYDGGLVIDENGDVSILRNQSLYRVEFSRSPFDCYWMSSHQI